MAHTHSSDILVIGGGLAGIVTALEALRQGQRVTLVDRDTPERLGGLALWAFGGMALVGTPLQARMKIPDTPERALVDWLAETDLFFHETNHGWHTPLAKLEALPAGLTGRMRLIHYPDTHDVDRSALACAREGDAFVP